MMRILFLFLLLTAFGMAATAQTEAEYEAEYARRIQLEMINDVYIPRDLDEAFVELGRLADPTGIEKFKAAPEEEISRKLHFGLGRWILINWGLEDGSRYSHFLREKGITTPDDMVRVTIVTWHRHLNGRPLDLDKEVALIQERMKKEQAEREANKVIVKKETRPHQPEKED
jgi:hypothetical protein